MTNTPFFFDFGSDFARKWADCQEAVTIPWPTAHSILKRIGGDTYMVTPLQALSSDWTAPDAKNRVHCKRVRVDIDSCQMVT